MKKLSLYSRKRAHLRTVSDPCKAAMATLARCRPFDEPPAFDFMENIGGNATDAMMMINDALGDLLHHRVQPEDGRAFGLLAHAVDVGHIRALQIDPDQRHPTHQAFTDAKAALNSLRAHRDNYGRWALSGSDRDTIAQAVDIYETILTSSSPQQMAKAVDIRKGALAKGKVWAPTSKGCAA